MFEKDLSRTPPLQMEILRDTNAVFLESLISKTQAGSRHHAL